MEHSNSGKNKGAFSADQAQRVLNSAEGKRLMEILNRDGGAALRAAAASIQSGDQEQAKRLIQPLLQNPEAAVLLQRLQGK